MSPQVAGVALPDPVEAWAAVGFTVAGDRVRIGSLAVEFDDGLSSPAWSLEGVEIDSVDGISCVPIRPLSAADLPNPNGAVGVDHVVVRTGNLDRTTDAFGAIGIEHRRSRPVGDHEQRFFWAGDTIVELVGPVEPRDEPARLWGLALVSADLDKSKAFLGDALSDPRDAVQPGRRIAAIRTKEHGISVTLALMTPHRRQATM